MSVEELEDPRRIDPGFIQSEREMLESWLDFHRITLLMKCDGLDDEARKVRPIATSLLSLHGLVRHMAEVERNWFQCVLHGRSSPDIWTDPDVDDSELHPLHEADWGADVATWQAECEASRAAARGVDLDTNGKRRGMDVSLRWIYVHMIEEYARHNGHADLIRELVDGTVGV
jgi:uncharacterized damage-inducible protein DinB